MISKDQLDRLATFRSASWAVWSHEYNEANSPEFDQDQEKWLRFLYTNTDRLNPRVVFVGLNRSRGEPADAPIRFRNYHARKHAGDRRLKCYIQEQNLAKLQGAFMTDINGTDVGPDSSKIAVTQGQADELIAQLQILRQPRFRVICFGRRAFNAAWHHLRCGAAQTLDLQIEKTDSIYEGLQLEIFGVWHYSSHGGNYKKVQALQRQLAILNDFAY